MPWGWPTPSEGRPPTEGRHHPQNADPHPPQKTDPAQKADHPDMVNRWALCILLECIVVLECLQDGIV